MNFIGLILCLPLIIALHFNGGTITWAPINPNSNSSLVDITITQTYSWSYPNVKCANDVPITSNGRSGENDNLTCVVDCSTDGGYSQNPINILTDCTSSSSSLGIMTSSRSKNVTLAAGAHFSLAYQGVAWRSLGSPAKSGLDWSILSTIDLRMRPDGFINTPPVATVISPQYAIVNQTTQIQIPVSDVNAGDDVRCRWAVYQAGYRRRRAIDSFDKYFDQETSTVPSHNVYLQTSTGYHRERRGTKNCGDSECQTYCRKDCLCTCTPCQSTNCGPDKCRRDPKCTAGTTIITTTGPTTTSPSTTSETMGTKKSTSSFPSRQAIDECGGICYPSSVPNGTTLSNCTLTFTGLIPGAWYAVAIQVC